MKIFLDGPNFKEIKTLFDGNMRHSSVLVIEDTLYVFFTKVGDIPEKILFSKMVQKRVPQRQFVCGGNRCEEECRKNTM